MTKQPLLTIAIPTYNRQETLEKTINQLSKERESSFLLLVSDNNSSDGTENMIRKYQKIMPNLIYNKNKNNLGFSGNIYKLYELAETRYIWFLSDDDTVLPNAIKNILRAIIKYEPVVALFNCTWINPYGIKALAGVKNDVIHNDISKLVDYQPIMRAVFLSILVVEKRISVEKIKKVYCKDKNNAFFHLTLSVLLLSDKFKLCEVSSSILHRNVGYKYGEFYKIILSDHLRAIFIVDHGLDIKKIIRWSKKQISTAFQLYFSQKVGLFKYYGNPTKETIKTIIEYYGLYSVFIFSFIPLSYIVPKFLFKFLYLIQLFRIQGIKRGIKIYKINVNRVFMDKRKSDTN